MVVPTTEPWRIFHFTNFRWRTLIGWNCGSRWFVGESSYQPTEFSAICSDHFTADCYLRPPTSKMPRLRPTAVPTVFAHNPPVKERSSSALEKRELYKVWCYWLQLHKVNALLIICTDTTKACKHKWICYRYLWLLLYRNNMKHFISDVSYNT